MSSDPIEVLRSLRGNVGLDENGPFLPCGRVRPDRTANVDAALDAAIASLSAPKPESAEAVFSCPTCPVSVCGRWQAPECPECGERCYLDPSAAPQQASAPVGVEAIADKIENDRTYWRSEAVADLRALAQQPAAVDEAMVERVTNAVVGWATLPGDLPAQPEKVAELREVISTALVGQHQGGTPE